MKRVVPILAGWCAIVLVAGTLRVGAFSSSSRSPATGFTTTSTAAVDSPVASSTTTTTLPLPPPRLVFITAFSQGHGPEVHSVAVDGSDERTEPLAAARTDQVSPDGTRVVFDETQTRQFHGCGFAGCSTTTTSAGDILIAMRDGSNPHQITNGGFNRRPRWSSRDTIAYLAHVDDSGQQDVVVLAHATGEQIGSVPVPAGFDVSDFAFSPDGQTIAYLLHNNQVLAPLSLHLFDLATGDDHELTQGDLSDISWSPDGTQIAAAAKSDATRVPNPDEIVAIPLDGGPVRVAFEARVPPPPGNQYECGISTASYAIVAAPQWSPDGAALAFLHNLDRLADDPIAMSIALVNADGSDVHTVRPATPTVCGGPTYMNNESLTLLGWRAGP